MQMSKMDALTDLNLGSLKITPSEYPDVRDCCYLKIEGLIDTYNSSDFKDKVMQLFNAGFYKFILDAQGMKYISSTGVGCIIAVLKDLRTNGGDLVLYKIPDEVYQVVQILGFAKIIRKFNSEKDINSHFGKKEDVFTFPAIACCPSCGKKLKVLHAGRFRCTKCNNIFSVLDNGDIILQVAALSPLKH